MHIVVVVEGIQEISHLLAVCLVQFRKTLREITNLGGDNVPSRRFQRLRNGIQVLNLRQKARALLPSGHFLGLQGAPRRYYAFTAFDYLQKTRGQNLVISLAAFLLVSSQFLFVVNFIWSLVRGRIADANPWRATTLEWTVPSPPPHGNFAAPPNVERWAYEYGVTTASGDFAAQTVPDEQVASAGERVAVMA